MARCEQALKSGVSAYYSDAPPNLCLLDPTDPMQRLRETGFKPIGAEKLWI